jgi:hypothetical protein
MCKLQRAVWGAGVGGEEAVQVHKVWHWQLQSLRRALYTWSYRVCFWVLQHTCPSTKEATTTYAVGEGLQLQACVRGCSDVWVTGLLAGSA